MNALRKRLDDICGGMPAFPLAVLFLLFFFDEFDTAAFNILAPNIREAFHLTVLAFGTIVVVNHFTSENLLLRLIEKRLARVARHIGFDADFPFDAFQRDSRLSIREVRPSNLFGYWKLLRCVNEKPASNPG